MLCCSQAAARTHVSVAKKLALRVQVAHHLSMSHTRCALGDMTSDYAVFDVSRGEGGKKRLVVARYDESPQGSARIVEVFERRPRKRWVRILRPGYELEVKDDTLAAHLDRMLESQVPPRSTKPPKTVALLSKKPVGKQRPKKQRMTVANRPSPPKRSHVVGNVALPHQLILLSMANRKGDRMNRVRVEREAKRARMILDLIQGKTKKEVELGGVSFNTLQIFVPRFLELGPRGLLVGDRTEPLELRPQEEAKLSELERSTKDPRVLARVRIIRLRAAGYLPNEIAGALGIEFEAVTRWIEHFRKQGVEGLKDHLAQAAPVASTPTDETMIEWLLGQKETSPLFRRRLEMVSKFLQGETKRAVARADAALAAGDNGTPRKNVSRSKLAHWLDRFARQGLRGLYAGSPAHLFALSPEQMVKLEEIAANAKTPDALARTARIVRLRVLGYTLREIAARLKMDRRTVLSRCVKFGKQGMALFPPVAS